MQTPQFLCFSPSALIAFNGVLWAIPGCTIGHKGFAALALLVSSGPDVWAAHVAVPLVVFALFSLMFWRIASRNVSRVAAFDTPMPLGYMMPVRSWATLLFMMLLGMSVRLLGLDAPMFVGYFYTGLGSALFVAAVRYLLAAWRLGRALGQ